MNITELSLLLVLVQLPGDDLDELSLVDCQLLLYVVLFLNRLPVRSEN